MEANLRILKSIKKLNENIEKTKEYQEKINKIQDNIDNIYNNIKNETNEIQDNQSKIQEDVSEVRDKILINQELIEKNQNDLKETINNLEKKILSNEQLIESKNKVINNLEEKILLNQELIESKNKAINDKIDNIKFRMPKDGKDGKDGIGKNGKDGQDGVGISDIKMNDYGEIITTLTNGKKIKVGEIRQGIGIATINQAKDGIGIKNAEIINGHLIITLTDNSTIDAGSVSGGTAEETDPIFTSSPAHSITNQDITNWNNKQNQLTAGSNITIENNVISATGGSGGASFFDIDFLYDEENDSYYIEVTKEEIINALDNGKIIRIVYEGLYYTVTCVNYESEDFIYLGAMFIEVESVTIFNYNIVVDGESIEAYYNSMQVLVA